MLKRWQPDQTEQDLSSLVSSRNAVQFLYEESLANGNADITRILGEALTCGDALIAGKQEISYGPKDALFYMYFLRAILGLPSQKVGHLLELLEWLKIIPPDREAGSDGDVWDGPKVDKIE
jgi:hypothetical protein